MKYSAVVVLALSSFALGAISDLPACAQKAITAAVLSTTDCTADDQACQCEPANKAAIQGAATTGVLADCGADKALEVLSAANAACENPSPAETTSSSSAAPSTTTSTIVESSSDIAPTTTKTTTAAPSTTVVATTTAAPTTTASLTPSPSANGTISASPSPTPSEFPGAAPKLAVGLGSFVALGLAALAAF